MNQRKVFASLVALLCLTLSASAVMAAADVRAMPDRQVRPGASLNVWGNAANGGIFGAGNANGEAYSWSFAPNPDVMVTDDGNLSGIVANDRFINEAVSFTLLGGSTREQVTATLDVGGTTDTVVIDIVDPTDPISDTPQENLAVEVNISAEDGLLFAYRQQAANGSWPHFMGYSTDGITANTGLCTLAFENFGHVPSQTTAYSPFVQQGLNYIFASSSIDNIIGHPGADFHSHIPAANCPSGACGINPTGNLFFVEGYAAGMGAVAVEGSGTPGAIITVGPPGIVGLTYKQYVEEWTDNAAYGQRDAGGEADGVGGWEYDYSSFGFGGDDMSIDSWNYFGLLGTETTFAGTFNPKIKGHIDTSLVNRQDPNAGPYFGRFGYRSYFPIGDAPGTATTCAGLAGLALEEKPTNRPAGVPSYPTSGTPLAIPALDTFTEKRDAALAMLGRTWGMTVFPGFATGNLGNHYVMATCCRGLREIQGLDPNAHVLFNDGTFGGTVGPYNWETNIPPGGDNITRGYWPYLVGSQLADGRWQSGFFYDNIFDTCTALLCLSKSVIGFCGDGQVGPGEQCDDGNNAGGDGCDANCQIEVVMCDDPNPRTQGYWHRQCLGTGEIVPGRNGRGPSDPIEPGFVAEDQPCADQKLEDLGFYGVDTCTGLDAVPASDKCEKALKQLTALILNTCTGYLTNSCEVDVSASGCTSTNVGDLIDEIAGLIQSGQCQQAAECAGAVNEGTALVSPLTNDEGASELRMTAQAPIANAPADLTSVRGREFLTSVPSLSRAERRSAQILSARAGWSSTGSRIYLVPDSYLAAGGMSDQTMLYRIVAKGRKGEPSLDTNSAYMKIRLGSGRVKRYLVPADYAAANGIPTAGTGYYIVGSTPAPDSEDMPGRTSTKKMSSLRKGK